MEHGPVNFGPLFVVSVTIGGGTLIWLLAHWSVSNVHQYAPWLLVVIILAVSWIIERVVAVRSERLQDDE